MWLGRSGKCPLFISLQNASEQSTLIQAYPSTFQFLQTLVPFADRWQYIQFTVPLSFIFEIISSLDIVTPWLETVAFNPHRYRPPVDPYKYKCGAFSMLRGHRISSFSVAGCAFLPNRLPIPWDQLTALTIDGHSWPGLQEWTSELLLRDCPPVADFARSICLARFETNDQTFSKSSLLAVLRTLPLTVSHLKIRGVDYNHRELKSPLDQDALEAAFPTPRPYGPSTPGWYTSSLRSNV
ncbi:hypothetical protein C8R45DRAFT_1074138 [Mycena sanguinolenta]|nr:hypothetical protein C8R45DRAFT_1074138 [Mycena sanguinolenta]